MSCCVVVCNDSQIWPSCSSPSPVMTITRPWDPFNFLAQAIPLAFEIPMPREPELASMPGMLKSGWPWVPPCLLKLMNRSLDMIPRA